MAVAIRNGKINGGKEWPPLPILDRPKFKRPTDTAFQRTGSELCPKTFLRSGLLEEEGTLRNLRDKEESSPVPCCI